jgi:NAD-dependent DNA ligase
MVDAAYAQLIGLCRGLLADGALVDSEIVTLHEWLRAHAEDLPEWPAQILARRVRDALSDGIIEPEERADLVQFIERAAGQEGTDRFDAPTTLPLDRPHPHIEYESRAFCLTGTFIYGPRKRVVASIEEWGGRVVGSPNQADYLVIGGTITPAWKFGTHGLKIEEAVRLRDEGRPVRIVSEAHWVTTLC